MNVPLDRLYHYIENIAKQVYGDVIIYRFWPHGSKKISDLVTLRHIPKEWKKACTTPDMYCNDQEPLNFEYYENISEDQVPYSPHTVANKCGLTVPRKNFRYESLNIWDHALLLHSEQRSPQIDLYKKRDFLPVYYWSHGIIARDWFRFAQHVRQNKSITHLFLIYGRGWTGTREYRLKLFEHLIVSNLYKDCIVKIQPVDHDTGQHYQQYTFSESKWRPSVTLEHFYDTGHLHSDLSADFDLGDYENTQIELVLETLFDDPRLHFTEKILRPIAMAQPFILVGAQGGLEYLKQYGFRTFSSVWSEDYDKISDPEQRLQAVVELMTSIKHLEAKQLDRVLRHAKEIAEFNKQRFFSQGFFDQITQELRSNMSRAFADLQNLNTAHNWRKFREQHGHNQTVQQELLKVRSQQEADEVYALAMDYYNKNSPKV